jgi:hypothetical protein
MIMTAGLDFEAKHVPDGSAGIRYLWISGRKSSAIASIGYGSVEVLIHDRKVMQIECRKKIRIGRDEHVHKSANRQLR